MSAANLIGTLGVAALLLAFLLNLSGVEPRDSWRYAALNAGGAALACYSAYLIGFIPFVVLEGVWTVVAVAALMRVLPMR